VPGADVRFSQSNTNFAMTTTTPSTAGYADVPVAATFASIRWRLDALAAQIGSANDLGAHAGEAPGSTHKAGEHIEKAAASCRQGSRRRTRNALRPAIDKLAQLDRSLASRKARRFAGVAHELREAVSSLRDDARAPEGVTLFRGRARLA
jgi:hypothetical protein